MVMLTAHTAPPDLKAWFKADMPAMLRFEGVLKGDIPGKIFTDDLNQPAWAMLVEDTYGTIFPAGKFGKVLLAQLIAELRAYYPEVLYGFWHDDTRYLNDLPAAVYDGNVLEFTDRSPNAGLDAYLNQVPEGCEVRRINAELYRLCDDYESDLARFGSVEKALALKIGFGIMRGDDLVAEAFASPPLGKVVEVGMTTRPPHRRKGYATLVCAHLIHACEAQGYQTYWNCNSANTPSVLIARKMGYRSEKAYRLLGWFDTD